MRWVLVGLVVGLGIIALVGTANAATFEVGYVIESPHPYPNNYDNTWTIIQSGATSIRLHFVNYTTEDYHDYIYILDANNNTVATYTGSATDVWTPWVSGNTIKVRLVSDASTHYDGFYIDKYQYNTTSLANSPWPMFMHDLNHTGRSPHSGTSVPDLRWSKSFTTRDEIKGSPVIGSDGTIYLAVGGRIDRLYAFYPNGTEKWNVTIPDLEGRTPALSSNGYVYVVVGGANDGIYAVDSNGNVAWNYTTEDDVYSQPAIGNDGTIYVGDDNGTIYAIYPNGSLKWKYNTGGGYPIRSSPAVDANGIIYIAEEDGILYAMYPNGTLKWSYNLGNDVGYSSPAIANDGTIYIDADGNLFAISPDGTKKWNVTLIAGRGGYSSPAIADDGTVYIGSGSKLYAIYPNGTVKWTFDTNKPIESSPAIDANGIIYIGSNDKHLYAIYPNGTMKWSYQLDNYVSTASPAIGSDGTIYIGHSGITGIPCKFYAFNDLTPPSVVINSPQNVTYNTSTIAINVSASDPSGIDTVIAQIDDTANITLTYQNGYYTGTTLSLTDGDHWIRIYANDTLGNMNSTESVAFTVDTVSPFIVINSPPSVYRNTTANLTIKITDMHPLNYSIYRNGTLVESGNYANNTQFNVSINTTQLGFWNYTITANDTAGNTNQTSVIVEVRNNPPVANFTVSKTTAKTSETVTFNASQSYDPDGSIVSYSWNFGDGSAASGVTVTHSYASAGTYTVTLTITDNDGDSSSATAQITVTSPPARRAGGGGGGGGAAFIPPPLEAPPEVKHVEARYFPANREVTFKPPSKIVEAADIIEVVIKPKETATVTFAISKAKSLPREIPKPPYDTYEIFEIGLAKYGTTTRVDAEGKVKFRVSKSWLGERGYTEEQILLMKYTSNAGKWVEVPAEVTGEDNSYVYYESTLSSFSVFAIVAKPSLVIAETTPSPLPMTPSMGEMPKETMPKETQPAKSTKITPEKRTPGFDFLAAIAAMATLAISVRRSRF